jgi:hypothetical protein
MIALETSHSSKSADTAPSSPLNISASDSKEESKLSFSELLRGAGKKDEKVVQNGALLLSLEGSKTDAKTTVKSEKNEILSSLLKGEEGVKTDSKELAELNPKLTQTLDSKEVKTLIADAKEYLKSQILDSDGYKKSQIQELPKTLKGLVDMAKTIGVDISKVTMQEVQPTKEQNVKLSDAELKALKTQENIESKDGKNVKGSEVQDSKGAKTDSLELKTSSQLNSDEKDVAKVAKTINDVVDKKVENKTQDRAIVDDTKKEVLKQTETEKSAPLFKAQSSKEHTTEQIVQTKQFKLEEKTPKDKANDTLKLLLRGEKPSMTSNNLTADFSVATARVLAPTATTDTTKSLESLLRGDQGESTTASKIDGLTTHKSDSFEVKLNEAKQMIKYLSQDVKTAIEDYKSPFTRVKIQLNPQKLGEVDLTIVQRGKNLHVNISSNSVAINTLAMNANELKIQLTNSGINNASLNFSDNSQNSDQNASQQQNRQNERRADEEYNYFENEEANEEILSSLEIIVPQYG